MKNTQYDSTSDVTWAHFAHEAPDLARRVHTRFESHRHAVLATLRRDGSARLSGLEAPIRGGHLWLGMMPGSRKAADLHADARFSLHSAPDNEELAHGDARIDGEAVAATQAEVDLFIAGHRMPVDDPDDMVLFTTRITRTTLTRVVGDELVIESWTPTHGPQQFHRR